nr:dna-(apurinic or apyrimidinic site) lyase 2 [Quercus suber]
MFDGLGSDIIVMQELKIQRKDLRDDMVLLDGWDCFFSLPKHKKGYSGVGIYTRNAVCAPIHAEEGLLGVLPSASGIPYCELNDAESIGGYPNALQVAELSVDPVMLDSEGRCVIVEFPAFVLIGVYSPANSNGLRDDFRHGFICALDCRIRNLIRCGKNVVLVGDLNVSRDERDTASSTDDMKKAGISHADYISTPNRRIFNQMLLGGEVVGERDEGREEGVLWDTCRGFHPDRTGMYTHWEQKVNARPGNFGSRIDFVLVSEKMQSWIKDANIQEGLLGSDHCPVYADFHDKITIGEIETDFLDLLSAAGTFDNGVRQKDWTVQSAPAFSARRLPEFDKRRTIKSMFAAPTLKKAQSTAAEQIERESHGDVQDPPLGANSSSFVSSQAVSIISTQSPSPLKRNSPSVTNKTQATKRLKQADAPSTSAKGQQSLKGFFHKRPSAIEPPSVGPSQSTTDSTPDDSHPKISDGSRSHRPNSQLVRPTTPPPPPSTIKSNPLDPAASPSSSAASPILSPSQIHSQIVAAEQTQRSWSTLFARPVAPLCESHTEPCKTMQTKKKGSNQGRSFWMCARPLGPSGQKEMGTQWRCGTFIWCSDWGGRKDGENLK